MANSTFAPAKPIRGILVPLDGSRLAEAAVAPAVALASAFRAAITLLHVLEASAPTEVHGDRHLTQQSEAIAYLTDIAERFAAPGVTIESHVHANPERDVSGSIVSHAEEMDTDLIVLANHGSGGIRGFIFGRVAQQVVQKGRRPVLAVPVHEGSQPSSGEPHRLALLLNSTPESESAIPIALTFAQALNASLHLIFAVPTLTTLDAQRSAAATLLPSAAREMLNIEERDAEQYLSATEDALRIYGIEVTTAVVRGEPAQSAINEAVEAGVDLVIFTTHARGGLSGLWAGSIGSKILARTQLPLLLVPAPIA